VGFKWAQQEVEGFNDSGSPPFLIYYYFIETNPHQAIRLLQDYQ